MKNDVINSDDKSLILRLARERFFIPLVKRVPVSVKPNLLTIFGFISVLLFSYFTYLSTRAYTPGYVFAALALLLYLIADNIDGMHARNTNQTSPLGGFLDQWFDAISFLIITMSLCSVMRLSASRYLAIILLMALVNLILYKQQHISGSFHKPAFGPNEFLGSIIIMYLMMFLFHRQIAQIYHFAGLKNTNGIAYVTILVSVVYIMQSLTKVKMSSRLVVAALFFHGITLIPYVTHRVLSPALIGIFIIGVNSIFIAKILCTIYALPILSQSLFSYLLLSFPGLKATVTLRKKE